MAEGDNTFPTDSARARSVLKHDWKKMINDIIFENNLNIKVSITFYNKIFSAFFYDVMFILLFTLFKLCVNTII